MKNTSLGPLEQEVMECIWGREHVSVRNVYTCLKKRKKIAYTTVMTIMSRLTEKGVLMRKKQGKAYIYSPKKTKQQTARSVVKRMFDTLIDQYGTEAVTAFTDELEKRK